MAKRLFLKASFLLFCPFIVACTQITTIPKYNMASFDKDITHVYSKKDSYSTSVSKRLTVDSEYFMGSPYILGALGEGKNAIFDKSPLYRTDAFDCTTFVSTVLALVQSDNLTEFKKNIIKVRYKNTHVSFVNRNHFISVDWNITNEKNGYLKDINRDIRDMNGKRIAVEINTLINRPNWYRNLPMSAIKRFHKIPSKEAKILLKKLHHLASCVTAQHSQMYYLPMNKLFIAGMPNQHLFSQIPSGVVIEIVRQDPNLKTQIGTDLDISHMGFGIRINGQLIFREASIVDKKIKDTPLEDYLAQFLDEQSIKGIRLEKIILK